MVVLEASANKPILFPSPKSLHPCENSRSPREPNRFRPGRRCTPQSTNDSSPKSASVERIDKSRSAEVIVPFKKGADDRTHAEGFLSQAVAKRGDDEKREYEKIIGYVGARVQNRHPPAGALHEKILPAADPRLRSFAPPQFSRNLGPVRIAFEDFGARQSHWPRML